MKNLFLVMAASLFGLSASAQVLITDAEYLSRRTERVEARAARNSADLKRMDSIVMSKGYRFVPDQFQQMPAGVAHTIYNPNFSAKLLQKETTYNLGPHAVMRPLNHCPRVWGVSGALVHGSRSGICAPQAPSPCELGAHFAPLSLIPTTPCS